MFFESLVLFASFPPFRIFYPSNNLSFYQVAIRYAVSLQVRPSRAPVSRVAVFPLEDVAAFASPSFPTENRPTIEPEENGQGGMAPIHCLTHKWAKEEDSKNTHTHVRAKCFFWQLEIGEEGKKRFVRPAAAAVVKKRSSATTTGAPLTHTFTLRIYDCVRVFFSFALCC